MSPGHFELPTVKSVAWRAIPKLLEGVFIPTLVFLTLLKFGGPWAAMIGAFLWSALVISTRMALGRKVPTLVAIGLAVLGLRTIVAVAAQSSFVYFVQPPLMSTIVGLALIASAIAGRPIVLRIARDFCPIPDDAMSHGHLRRCFLGLSFVWGAVQLLNAAMTLWLLLSQSLGTFVVIRTTVAHTMTATAILISVVWIRRVAARPMVPAFALTA
jgi:hypothetical protein